MAGDVVSGVNRPDLLITPDVKGDPSSQTQQRNAHPVVTDHAAAAIPDERIWKIEASREGVALFLSVVGHTNDGDTDLLQLLVDPAKLAGLERSAGCKRLRKEEDCDVAGLEQRMQPGLGDLEVGRLVTSFEHGSLPLRECAG